MAQNHPYHPTRYSTSEAAGELRIRPQTLRAALCRQGHYYGIRPIKLANRLLAWPAEAIDRLAAGEEVAQ